MYVVVGGLAVSLLWFPASNAAMTGSSSVILGSRVEACNAAKNLAGLEATKNGAQESANASNIGRGREAFVSSTDIGACDCEQRIGGNWACAAPWAIQIKIRESK